MQELTHCVDKSCRRIQKYICTWPSDLVHHRSMFLHSCTAVVEYHTAILQHVTAR